MPFPYPTIPRPPGDWKDPFDNQAIEMSLVHNLFVRALNAIYAQAEGIRDDQAKAFAFFGMIYCQGVHHHHHTEETYLFPKYNEKLGANAMDQNIEQHHAFLDGLNDLESYFKEVHAGTTPYNGAIVIQKIDGFADDLVLHLNEEIATLESSRMRAALTAEDLKDIEDTVKKIVLKNISFFKGLPMGLVCHDKSSAPHWPPLPKALIWATQYGFRWRHNDAWEFAPCDIFGNIRPGRGN
ncbi:hypothetical protein B0H13DRAFT_1901142 [Mycena leptocephala]|nr:hypothetical protein B0H13DRAFT_1901142 [Mycena leptocephala]